MTLDAYETPAAAADTSAAGPAQRRRDALADARTELADAAGPASEPAMATRSYGDGELAVSLAGTFDRAAVERLRGTLRNLRQAASNELVIDLSGLATCNSALARFLAQLRVQRLISGARVEIHDAPTELTTAMGHSPAQEFTVHDQDPDRARSPSHTAMLHARLTPEAGPPARPDRPVDGRMTRWP